jgi:hypothetical protein
LGNASCAGSSDSSEELLKENQRLKYRIQIMQNGILELVNRYEAVCFIFNVRTIWFNFEEFRTPDEWKEKYPV